MVNWFVIHEYETYNDSEPTHAWYVVGKYKTKEEAELIALDMNFDKYCNDMPERYKNIRAKELNVNEKYRIVVKTFNNIHKKVGSANQWRGIGFYIISDDRIKVRNGVKNIKDIRACLSKEELDELDNGSESEYEEEDGYESGSSTEEEDNKELESENEELSANEANETDEVQSNTSNASDNRSVSSYDSDGQSNSGGSSYGGSSSESENDEQSEKEGTIVAASDDEEFF